jgi:hypothetical protein
MLTAIPKSKSYNDERGMRRLAGAMLISALDDLDSQSHSRRGEVLNWISRSDGRIFSFEFCCEMLGRDPNELRRKVETESYSAKSTLGMRIVARRTVRA